MRPPALTGSSKRFGLLVAITTLALLLGACAGWWPPDGRDQAGTAADRREIAAYIGKYVLITLTYFDEDGDVVAHVGARRLRVAPGRGDRRAAARVREGDGRTSALRRAGRLPDVVRRGHPHHG